MKSKYILRRAFMYLAAAMSVAGIAACDNDDDGEKVPGLPGGTFEITGTVTDEQGAPLPNVGMYATDPFGAASDTVMTDVEGKYLLDGETKGYSKSITLYAAPGEDSQYQGAQRDIRLQFKLKTDVDKTDEEVWELGHAESVQDFTLVKL